MLDTTLAREIETLWQTSTEIDEMADSDLDLPPRPDPALTLADLGRALQNSNLMPAGTEASPIDGKDFRLTSGQWTDTIRITLERSLYEDHTDLRYRTQGKRAFL